MLKKKKEYVKPKVIKMDKMNFPIEIIKSLEKKHIVCRQCSSCHGCR